MHEGGVLALGAQLKVYTHIWEKPTKPIIFAAQIKTTLLRAKGDTAILLG
jgi:hypothetical protein